MRIEKCWETSKKKKNGREKIIEKWSDECVIGAISYILLGLIFSKI